MGNGKCHMTLVRLELLEEVTINHQSTCKSANTTNVTRFDNVVKLVMFVKTLSLPDATDFEHLRGSNGTIGWRSHCGESGQVTWQRLRT